MHEWSDWRFLLAACALLIAPAFAVWDGWTYMRLSADGVTAIGTVTYKRETYHDRSRSYDVEYAFRDAGGRRLHGSQSIDRQRYRTLRVGQPIQVVYSAAAPDLNVAYMEVLRERVTMVSLISLLIAVAVGGCMWWWHHALAATRRYDAEMLGPPAA